MNKVVVTILSLLFLFSIGFSETYPEWSDSKLYKSGDIVTFKGGLWEAQREVFQNTPPKESDKGWFWQEYILQRSGDVVPTWNDNKGYEKGDFVIYQGKKWEAQRKVFLNTPPKESDKGWFWQESTKGGRVMEEENSSKEEKDSTIINGEEDSTTIQTTDSSSEHLLCK